MHSKSREITIRRTLERRGLRLERCRRRDPHAAGFGRYRIATADGQAVSDEAYTLSLDQAEAWTREPRLNELPRPPTRQPRAKPRPPPVTLHVGDALATLKTLPDGRFAACVTSPPYYWCRTNGHPGEIGRENTPQRYVRRLVGVFREVRRVLRDDGICWIVIDDGYSTHRAVRKEGKRGVVRSMVGGERLPRWSEDKARGLTQQGVPGYALKQLLLIPQRLAIALQDDGWWVRSQVIWSKPTVVPGKLYDRPRHTYEPVLMLVKRPKYQYLGHHLFEEARDGSHRWGHDVWHIRQSNFASEHTSAMPEELARRCILAASRPGQEIIDCFGGAGTVGLVAAQNRRRAFLIELLEDHARIIRDRLGGLLG